MMSSLYDRNSEFYLKKSLHRLAILADVPSLSEPQAIAEALNSWRHVLLPVQVETVESWLKSAESQQAMLEAKAYRSKYPDGPRDKNHKQIKVSRQSAQGAQPGPLRDAPDPSDTLAELLSSVLEGVEVEVTEGEVKLS